MRTPYQMYFEESYVKEESFVYDKLPGWCTYPLKYAQQNVVYSTPEYKILKQSFNYKPFVIDLFEVICDQSLKFFFEIKEKQLFMSFMLLGNMEVFDEKKGSIAKTSTDNFMMSYYDAGKYGVKLNGGKQIVLVVTIHPEWLEQISFNYKNICRVLKEYKKAEIPCQTMYQGRMDRNIRKCLDKLYTSQKQDVGIFDGFLRMHMASMLKHYDRLLDTFWLAFDVRQYIINNLFDDTLGVHKLSEHFNRSKRVLRYQFNNAFGQNITIFINEKRIEYANELIRKKGFSISEVFARVGYKDEGTFRYHYNRSR